VKTIFIKKQTKRLFTIKQDVMKKLLFFIVAAIFISTSSFGQYGDVKYFSQSDLIFETIQGYDLVYFEGCGFTEDIGAPQMPVFVLRYLIPLSAKLDSVYIVNKTQEQIAGNYYLLPGQHPIILDGSPAPEFVYPNDSIYNLPGPYPGRDIELVNDGNYMGRHIVTIRLLPLVYFPYDSVLDLNTSLEFIISYSMDNGTFEVPKRISFRRSEIIERQVESLVENFEITDDIDKGLIKIESNNYFPDGLQITTQPSISGSMPDYIIITNNELKPSFSELALWKTKKGVPSIVVTIEEIIPQYEGVDDQEKIRNYLKDVYKYWGPGIFLLIGGDVEIVPSRNYQGNGLFTDLYYATIDGNWNANGNNYFGECSETTNIDNVDFEYDFFLGRAPVESEVETNNFINKIISYEQLDMISDDQEFVKNSLFIEGFTSSKLCQNDITVYSGLFSFILEEIVNEILPVYMYSNKWFIFDNELCDDPLHCSYWPSGTCTPSPELCVEGDRELSKDNVLYDLNLGGDPGHPHIIFHRDHSGPTAMGASSTYKSPAESISINDVDELNNLEEGPFHQIIFSGGCSTTEFFHEQDCIAEHFVNNSLGGSVAFMGFAADSYTNAPNGVLTGPNSFFKDFCMALYGTLTFNNLGNNLGIPFQYSTIDRVWSRINFTLLGDPELPVWTNTPNLPNPLNVSFDPQNLVTGDNNLTVTINNLPINEFATVCLYKENEVFLYKTIIGTGNEIEELFTIQPNLPGNLSLTVTAKNFTPVIIQINVNTNPGIHLFVSDYLIDDTNFGNGDGKLDSGETVELGINISNSGQTDATNVNAVLSSEYKQIEESFEFEFPPQSWIIEGSEPYWFQSIGTVNPPGGGVANEDKLIYYNSSGLSGTQQIINTPKVFLLNSELRFFMYHDNGFINNDDRLQVKIKPVGGLEWQDIEGALFHRHQTVSGWVDHIVDLGDYSNNEFYIGFQGIAEGGNDIHIDYVRVVSKFILVDQNFNYSHFGNINSGTSVQNATNYKFQVDPNIPWGNFVPLNLSITAENNYNINDEFYVQCLIPQIKLNTVNYITSNGDDIIEENEIVLITYELKNIGLSQAKGISGSITSTSSYIEEIIEPYQVFGDINSFTFLSNEQPFQFRTIDNFIGEPNFLHNLIVQDIYGKVWNFFNIDLKKPGQVENIDFIPYPNEILLYWLPKTDVKGYNVYRNIVNDWVKLNYNIIEGYAGYLDTYELEPNTSYNYYVTSISNSGLESSPSYANANTSLAVHSGWPVTINNLGKRTEGSIVAEDIIDPESSNDGKKEIFLTIYGTNDSGEKVGGIIGLQENGEKIINNESGFVDYPINNGSKATPAIGDINSEGPFEVLVPKSPLGWSNDLTSYNSETGEANWTHDNYSANYKGVVISNLDNSSDGSKEIINVNFENSNPNSKIFVLNNDGSNYNGDWPKVYPENYAGENYLSYGMPAVSDIDNDGKNEIVLGLIGGLYIWKHNGYNYLNNSNPVFTNTQISEIVSDPNITLFRLDCPAIIANMDMDLDNSQEIVFMAGGSNYCFVFITDNNGYILPEWGENNIHRIEITRTVTGAEEIDAWMGLMPGLSVGNIDNDDDLEIVVADYGFIHAWNINGEYLPAFPISCENLKMDFMAPLLADVDMDSDIEIIIASNYGKIKAYNLDGSTVFGFPLQVDEMYSNPCITDIDFDGKNEIVAGSSKDIYVWDTEGDADRIEWGMYRHDSYNSGVYGNDICHFYCGENVIEENETVTWGNRRQTKNVRILDGGQLTITGRVAMPEGSKIIVERGGALIIDGGIVTNACDGLWRGVEVWGTHNQSQTTAYQGIVIVQNEGTIENAEYGIRTIKAVDIPPPGQGETLDYNYTGGIVYGVGGIFKNNKTAVRFYNYVHESSLSFFTDCEFITNNDLFPGVEVGNFIELNEFDGVDIYGSTFTESRIYIEPENRTSGIESYESRFFINDHNDQPSSFTGLYYGIRADAHNPLKTVKIENSEFINNLRSVYLNGLMGATINLNRFTPWDIIELEPQESWCLYLDYCTDYTVEENSFIYEPGNPKGIGLIINQSGQANNEIYNNYFYNLQYATLAQNNNRGFFDEIGLKIKCNDYELNSHDIAVTSLDIPLPGIARYQGSSGNTTMQAGNRFSLNNNGITDSDYSTIRPAPITYFHHDPFLSTEPRVKPEYISRYISRSNEGTQFDKDESCKSNFSGGGGGGTGRDELLAEMNENEYKADSTGAILEALVDGGNSELLEQEVLQSMPPEAYDLYMSLMGKSPYLSDSVMIAAVEKENVLPNVLIKDVLVANPQSAKSNELLDKVDEKSNPFTEEMIAEVLLGKYIVEAKENLEALTAIYGQRRSTALKYLKQLYLNDTVNIWAHDSLIYLLENEEGLREKFELISAYTEIDNWTAASVLLNNLPTQFSLNAHEQEVYNDFKQFFDVMYDLYQSGDGFDSITADQNALLYDLADNSVNFAGAYARCILKQTYDYPYKELVLLPEEGLKSSNIVFDLPISETFSPEYVKLYPNPANDYFIVEFLTGNVNGATISIFDSRGLPVKNITIPGKQQHCVVNIKDLPTGVYLIKVNMDGRTLASVKLSRLK
jgi:hypothetical protein